jgi:hypothetical protein
MRAIILITVGATLFSLLNLSIDSLSRDRIASNIVAGVGLVDYELKLSKKQYGNIFYFFIHTCKIKHFQEL